MGLNRLRRAETAGFFAQFDLLRSHNRRLTLDAQHPHDYSAANAFSPILDE